MDGLLVSDPASLPIVMEVAPVVFGLITAVVTVLSILVYRGEGAPTAGTDDRVES